MDDAVLDRVFEAFERVFERRAKFACIIDLSEASVLPGARERRRVADWLERIAARQKLYNLGSAHVIRSVAVRGALTAVHWMFRPPTPQAYFAEPHEAFDWCVERLRAEGVAISPESMALRGGLVAESTSDRR